MKANELVVGDLIRFKHISGNCITAPHEITCIDEFNNEIHADGEIYDLRFWNIVPIPLTPGIFEKNGFVANKHVYPYPYYEYINEEDRLEVGFAFPQGDMTSYKEPWVHIDSERVFVEHLPCTFVNQLEQILRLCGIEKTIAL